LTDLGDPSSPTGGVRADDAGVDDAGADEVGAAGAEGPASAARLRAAAAMRRLGHALVAHDVDDDTFDRISADVDGWLATVEAAPQRTRSPFDMTREVFVVPPRQRGRRSDSIVSGKANPMGMAADAVRDGREAVMRITLGAAFEGAPGRAHGGVVAALLDEVMGFVLSIHSTAAYTGRLIVSYRAPTPIGVELEMRARLHSRHGRKLRIDAQARAGEKLVAEAEGLFVAVDPERFAAG
jgi:acyl-coenzyme A thioesterase PaaI-like protein